MAPIRLLIITPEETVADVRTRSVTLPGVVSPFQVLKDHAALITSLDPGQVRWMPEEGEEQSLAIRSGFVKVENNTVSVYAEL
ncbi:MAG: F0F1 ATP synthase subunit epsilon [Bacteroidales bacterium]|nr:F0F1 ATP synthase subunit epsilon [Bacteroidales bacterium]